MYNEEDHISNLFREKGQLLEERPSRNAWAKLEEKLDQDNARSTRRIYRYISTAAAVIAIVSMISAIALFRNGNSLVADNSTQKIAMNEQQQGELSVTDNSSDWRKEYAPEVIEEMEEVENIEEKTVLPTKETTKPIIADNVIPKSKTTKQPIVDIIEQPVTKPTVSSPVEEPIPAQAKTADKEIIAEVEKTEESTFPEAAWNMSDEIVYEETKTEATNAGYSNKQRSESIRKSKANTNTTDAYSTKKRKATKTTIADFQWLTGAWSNPTTKGVSYEQWKNNGKKSLEAKGYLVQNGDTTFVEKMQLKESRGKIYYYSNFGTDKTATKFELIQYQNGIATFENKKSKTPTKVIIRKNSDNSFTITFQEAITPKLQYRNNIENARASRKMSRVKF